MATVVLEHPIYQKFIYDFLREKGSFIKGGRLFGSQGVVGGVVILNGAPVFILHNPQLTMKRNTRSLKS